VLIRLLQVSISLLQPTSGRYSKLFYI